MPDKYTVEEKNEAFRMLVETMGDVYRTSVATGIPERTLRYWKAQYQVRVSSQPAEPQLAEDRAFKEQYRILREKVFTQITLTLDYIERSRTPADMALLSPTLTRFIDRLEKLENMLNDNDYTFTIQWINAEDLIGDEQRIKILARMQKYFEDHGI